MGEIRDLRPSAEIRQSHDYAAKPKTEGNTSKKLPVDGKKRADLRDQFIQETEKALVEGLSEDTAGDDEAN